MKKAALASAFLTMFISASTFAAPAVPGGGVSVANGAPVADFRVINSPSAAALDAGQFSISHQNHSGDATISQAHFGIGGHFEIGVIRYSPDTGKDATYGNLKYQFIKESDLTPAISVGVLDFTDKYERNAYVVGSKTLPVTGTKLSLGLYQKGDDKVFASLEQPILFGTAIKVEYDRDDVNFGLSLTTIAGLKLEVGSRNDHGYWGASWTF